MDPSKAKANFSRVCQLLVDKGGDALRITFHKIHSPSTLAAVLNSNRHVLQRIRSSVIADKQWELLFPTTGDAPDSNNFDITLLTILLRNICNLPRPATGWNTMPLIGDTSTTADIVRIKIFRNDVYGHIANAQLNDSKFENLWQKISKPLIRLGIPQQDIDEIKVAPLSPEEERCIEKLKEWKEREDNILSKLNNVENELSNLRKTLENYPPSQCKPEEWEPSICLPDRLPMFTGRKVEIQNVIAFLIDQETAVVSLHGGPGFGKTAIAIQVSHRLNEDLNIPVVFSQLTRATTVDEMIRQLCLDVGVNHEDDPKSSFLLWLRNINRKVIFVMDDVDNLLEDKSDFYAFVRLLRKNSRQYCQIITTSRTSCEIRELTTNTVQVDEMSSEACMELLKRQCPEQDVIVLQNLAKLCGHVPLAMCIAGSLVDKFEDCDELLQHLEKQPMKTLKDPNSNQYVNRAIELSYEKLSDEEQEMFVRLSVFEGSFNKDAGKVVLEKDTFDTADILHKLVSRSLIKQPIKHRYSIHLLIKHFLNDKQKNGHEKRAFAAAKRAEVLMIQYYLELGHQLTMKSYSKDGYKDNREALKQESANIHNVLKMCCQQEDTTSSDISDCLANSKIYTTSAKFFSLFVRTIIPGSIVDEFLQRSVKLAEERKQHAIKINFDCVLADQERSKSIGRSDKKFFSKIEEIKKEFETRHEDLQENKSLCAYYYSQYGKYLSRQAQKQDGKKRLRMKTRAREQLQKSLELTETLTGTSEGKADKVFSLVNMGNICKQISSTERYLNKKNEDGIHLAFRQSQMYHEEAVQLSQDNLGEHELTSSCYKNLGDLLLKDNPEIAEEKYTIAKQMRENLDLDASERHVLLLNNLGKCLKETKRAKEAIEILESARDTAEKLAENDEPNVCKTKVYTSLAIANNSVKEYSKAVYYAEKALKFDQINKIVKNYEVDKLQQIFMENRDR